jgi:hypothetical protein
MTISHDERQARLAPVIEGYRRTPFTWQVHDCVLLAARCVDAQIGTRLECNIQRDFHYTGPVAALRIVKEAGGWEPLISRYLGPSVVPSELEFGDVVLGHANPPFERTSLIGICDEELFIAPGSECLQWLSMKNAIMGWKIENIPCRRAA